MSATPPAPRAAIYCRISLDRAEGAGVERQEETCRSLAELHGAVVTHVLTDNSISAYKNTTRSAYDELITLIEHDQIDCVYVYSIDRLTRRAKQLINYIELCRPKRIITHAVTGEGLDPNSANSTLVATILGAVSEQESAHKAERISAAYYARAKHGRPKRGGTRMFGYEIDGETIREDEAQFIRQAAQAVIAGESLRSIAARGRALGLTGTRGRVMESQTVRNILLNPRITAISTITPTQPDGTRRRHHREKLAEGEWPAIIDRDTFDAVGAILTDARRKTNHTGNTANKLLSGLLTCLCGDPMYGRTRSDGPGGARVAYYRCKNTNTGHKHCTVYVEPADEFITEVVIARLSAPDFAEDLAAANDTDPQLAAHLSELTTRRHAVLARRDELDGQVMQGAIDVATFARLEPAMTQQLDELDKQIAAITSALVSDPLLAEVPGPDQVREWFQEADLEIKRRIISSLMTIRVGPGKRGAKSFDPRRMQITWKIDPEAG